MKLCTGKLSPIVWHDNVWNSMDSKDASQFGNQITTSLVIKAAYLWS